MIPSYDRIPAIRWNELHLRDNFGITDTPWLLYGEAIFQYPYTNDPIQYYYTILEQWYRARFESLRSRFPPNFYDEYLKQEGIERRFLENYRGVNYNQRMIGGNINLSVKESSPFTNSFSRTKKPVLMRPPTPRKQNTVRASTNATYRKIRFKPLPNFSNHFIEKNSLPHDFQDEFYNYALFCYEYKNIHIQANYKKNAYGVWTATLEASAIKKENIKPFYVSKERNTFVLNNKAPDITEIKISSFDALTKQIAKPIPTIVAKEYVQHTIRLPNYCTATILIGTGDKPMITMSGFKLDKKPPSRGGKKLRKKLKCDKLYHKFLNRN